MIRVPSISSSAALPARTHHLGISRNAIFFCQPHLFFPLAFPSPISAVPALFMTDLSKMREDARHQCQKKDNRAKTERSKQACAQTAQARRPEVRAER